MEKYMIIGNGIAALTAIDAIREIDQKGEVHLFGKENRYPYNRICLSKGLIGSLDEEKILLRKKSWYTDNQVNLHLNHDTLEIDTKEQFVKFNTEKLSYSKLLIASGASNTRLPIEGIDLEGVATLRTYTDAENILKMVEKTDQILHIGGGIQGLEIAWNLSKLGKKVIIAELMDRLMPKQLDEKASKILYEAMISTGFEIHLKTQIHRLVGSGRVTGFETIDKSSFPCDGVLYSIGITPNTQVIEGTPLEMNKGVLVNDQMATNIPNVYAAGDVAEFQGRIYGLWNIAIAQGKVAGYNMVGKKSIYEHMVPVTTLNAFGIQLFSMGVVDDQQTSDDIVEENKEDKSYSKIFIKDKKVIGAIIIGNTKNTPIIKTAIEKELDLSTVDFENVTIDALLQAIKLINQ